MLKRVSSSLIVGSMVVMEVVDCGRVLWSFGTRSSSSIVLRIDGFILAIARRNFCSFGCLSISRTSSSLSSVGVMSSTKTSFCGSCVVIVRSGSGVFWISGMFWLRSLVVDVS